MKWEDIWAPVAVVVGSLFGLVILVKVLLALWRAQLPLAILGITISSFLVNCLSVVILILGFLLVILAIAFLASKTTEYAMDLLREIRRLKESHSAEILALFLATATEITAFTLSKDFAFEAKAILALYLLTAIGICHMMISANTKVKIVGRSLLGVISVFTASWIVYHYQLYLSQERASALRELRQWFKNLRGTDWASLSLMVSLFSAILVMTFVSARSKDAVES